MDEGGIVVLPDGRTRGGGRVLHRPRGCDGFQFGFCVRAEPETGGTLTFVVPDRAGVEAAHERLGDAVDETPHYNETYAIYETTGPPPDVTDPQLGRCRGVPTRWYTATDQRLPHFERWLRT